MCHIYVGGDRTLTGARAKHIWKEGYVPKFFFFFDWKITLSGIYHTKNKAKTQKSVTFQLFLYWVFSNLLLKKKKTTFHWDFMHQKKTLEGAEKLSCFHMSGFLRVSKRKTEKWSVDLMKKKNAFNFLGRFWIRQACYLERSRGTLAVRNRQNCGRKHWKYLRILRIP